MGLACRSGWKYPFATHCRIFSLLKGPCVWPSRSLYSHIRPAGVQIYRFRSSLRDAVLIAHLHDSAADAHCRTPPAGAAGASARREGGAFGSTSRSSCKNLHGRDRKCQAHPQLERWCHANELMSSAADARSARIPPVRFGPARTAIRVPATPASRFRTLRLLVEKLGTSHRVVMQTASPCQAARSILNSIRDLLGAARASKQWPCEHCSSGRKLLCRQARRGQLLIGLQRKDEGLSQLGLKGARHQ